MQYIVNCINKKERNNRESNPGVGGVAAAATPPHRWIPDSRAQGRSLCNTSTNRQNPLLTGPEVPLLVKKTDI